MIRRLRTIAAEHPEMPLRDALDTIGLELDTRPDDEEAWLTYAQAAVPALVRTDSAPGHVADRAAAIADALLLQHRQRYP